MEPRHRWLGPRALFAVTFGALLVGLAGTAVAKVAIAEARITGPGLDGSGVRISAADADGLWQSGFDLAGGLDDARAESIQELDLTARELGPRYVVTYDLGSTPPEIVRQDLYPYAPGGPVTYTPPGQRVAEGQPWGGAVTAGWYRAPSSFLDYLVEQGLPETRYPGIRVQPGSIEHARSADGGTPWGWVAAGLTGVAAGGALLRMRRSRPHPGDLDATKETPSRS